MVSPLFKTGPSVAGRFRRLDFAHSNVYIADLANAKSALELRGNMTGDLFTYFPNVPAEGNMYRCIHRDTAAVFDRAYVWNDFLNVRDIHTYSAQVSFDRVNIYSYFAQRAGECYVPLPSARLRRAHEAHQRHERQ